MGKMKKIWGGIWILAIVFLVFAQPEYVKADTAAVTFGEASYAAESNGEFQADVYINGESKVGAYYVVLKYDSARMKYTGGAEAGGDGMIILEGTGTEKKVKYTLSFQMLSGGEAYIQVSDAFIHSGENGNTESLEITEKNAAVVSISGTDTVGDISEEEVMGFETRIPHIEPAILLNNAKHYMLDITRIVPGDIKWDYELIKLEILNQYVTFLTNQDRSIYFAYLIDESEDLICYAYNTSQKMFYPCKEYALGENLYTYVSPSACEDWPEGLTQDIVKEQNIVYTIDQSGKGGFSHLDKDGNVVTWDIQDTQQNSDAQNGNGIVLKVVVAIIVIFLAAACVYFLTRGRKKMW